EEEQQESSKVSIIPRVLIGAAVFVVAAAGTYWFFAMRGTPVPAEIPQGDILAAISTNSSAAPPNSANPAPAKAEPQKTAQPPTIQPAPPVKRQTAVPTAQPTTQPQQKSVAENPTTVSSPQSESQPEISQEALSGIFGANPFVDLASLRSMVSASTASARMDLPRVGGSGNMALPDVPRPSVSPELLPSPGEIHTPPAPFGSTATAAPTVGGIIKGANGSSIAIMGDGTVLSEGDTYKGDRRVTFIGGEGLEFDNGDSIPFGEHKK
ncbi:MAG: hypothetical protein IJS08_18120, partial [Victivallales bacterium]|nr:hypothetical protein [Victivallales bacterium]